MSLLTPLYVLGLLAVSLPVIFHLIRRMPKGEFAFSSLMFLSPSPPRLTRRSRLENILLLALRAAVLSLLAFAFARPFLRQDVPTQPTSADQRRVAIVVDTSASMRRGDLWQQAVAMVGKIVAECRPLDEIAVFACDDALRPLASFQELSQFPPGQRAAAIAARLKAASPTWAGTALGQCLMDAVEIVSDVRENQNRQRIAPRIVLVSDMQHGSRLAKLSDYPWPQNVELDLRPVRLTQSTNAGLHRLGERASADSEAAAQMLRVHVSNDAESTVDQFQLQWLDDADHRVGEPISAYVPAGESRVVRVRRPQDAAASRLRLSGDSCDFDNTLYLATRPEEERNVVYLGTDRPDDARSLRYYLERALTDGLSPPVRFVATAAGQPLGVDSPVQTPLVVVATEPTREQVEPLRKYAESGGTLLFVLTGNEPPRAWASIVNMPHPLIDEAEVTNYTMLRRIAFDHPLFATMAGPHFNDFTQIRFWKYRRIPSASVAGANILARFENGDAALVEWRVGKGQMYVLTSGWHPTDSQLARSWKFVLLVSAMVDGSGAGRSDRVYFLVNEPVPLSPPERAPHQSAAIKPDGTSVVLPETVRSFDATDMPGIYSLASADGEQKFAVNLDPLESQTAPMDAETLEQLGCRLVGPAAVAQNQDERQHLHDAQLENRQKIWQWLIASALGLVVTETWLAGRATNRRSPKEFSA